MGTAGTQAQACLTSNLWFLTTKTQYPSSKRFCFENAVPLFLSPACPVQKCHWAHALPSFPFYTPFPQGVSNSVNFTWKEGQHWHWHRLPALILALPQLGQVTSPLRALSHFQSGNLVTWRYAADEKSLECDLWIYKEILTPRLR